ALDGVDIFLLLLDRIGVVEAQMTTAAELLRHAEVENDRLGVADMQIAVRLRRKAGHYRALAFGPEVRPDDVADEILPRLPHRRFADRHTESLVAHGPPSRGAYQIPAGAPRVVMSLKSYACCHHMGRQEGPDKWRRGRGGASGAGAVRNL